MPAPSEPAPAAAQVLRVLDLVSRSAEPLSAASIAAQLGLPRSTTYRLLGVLGDAGYVSHLPEERRYGLGLAAYELGSAYSRQQPLQRIGRAVVRRLVDATGQNAHLAVLREREVVYVVEERAPGRPVLVTDVGVRLPALATASGRAILAALPTAQILALYPDADAMAPHVARRSDLRALLGETRRRGHALEEGSVTAGLSSVSQSVRDHAGHPLAALAVTYEADRTPADEVEALVAALDRAADQLTRRLHGHA